MPSSPSKNYLRFLVLYLRTEAASGVVLVAATLVALGLANSPWGHGYLGTWEHALLGRSLHTWIDDGLMTVFFFNAGLEIRRELADGALSDRRKAALPIAAALGGMVAPALVFASLNWRTSALRGWGVPTATDIAFAVGILTLLGKRVPPALRALLLALAIADDIGAIAIVALFYGGGGIPTTVIGVALGVLAPRRIRESRLANEPLHRVVTYGIMPLFALANAGVVLGELDLHAAGATTALVGSALGLMVGKPVGILLASYTSVRLGLGRLPEGLAFRDLALLGVVAGVGFTMAIFIAGLAFASAPALLAAAKLGVLLGSLTAAALALVIGARR